MLNVLIFSTQKIARCSFEYSRMVVHKSLVSNLVHTIKFEGII